MNDPLLGTLVRLDGRPCRVSRVERDPTSGALVAFETERWERHPGDWWRDQRVEGRGRALLVLLEGIRAQEAYEARPPAGGPTGYELLLAGRRLPGP